PPFCCLQSTRTLRLKIERSPDRRRSEPPEGDPHYGAGFLMSGHKRPTPQNTHSLAKPLANRTQAPRETPATPPYQEVWRGSRRVCRCKRLRLHLCSSGAAWRLVTSGIGMFRVVEALGVRVVEVEGLHDVACMVDGEEVALVRADLTPDLRDRVVDWLLHEALGSGRASCA